MPRRLHTPLDLGLHRSIHQPMIKSSTTPAPDLIIGRRDDVQPNGIVARFGVYSRWD